MIPDPRAARSLRFSTARTVDGYHDPSRSDNVRQTQAKGLGSIKDAARDGPCAHGKFTLGNVARSCLTLLGPAAAKRQPAPGRAASSSLILNVITLTRALRARRARPPEVSCFAAARVSTWLLYYSNQSPSRAQRA